MTWLAASAETGTPLFWTPSGDEGFSAFRQPPFMVPGSELMLGTRDKTPVKKLTRIVPLFELSPEEATHEGLWQALKKVSPAATHSTFYFSEDFLAYFLTTWARDASYEVQQLPCRIMVACYALGFSE